MRYQHILAGLLLAALPAWAGSVEQAQQAHGRALALLAEGDASGAEAAAREALSISRRFIPEQEIAERPEKGLLFDEMIAEARSAYRTRRADYFLTLGRVLTNQQRWIEARKALSRAARLTSSAKPHLVMASHADLSPAEKVDALLVAFFAPDADQHSIEQELVATGAFPSRDALQAFTDQKRIDLEVVPDFPSVQARVGALPEVRVASTRGMVVSTEVYQSGAFLAFYLPAAGCNRCSEELDGLSRAIRETRGAKKDLVLTTFVEEADLVSARRIARLLALKMEVGRLDLLPKEYRPLSEGEILIVAREGLLQVRIDLSNEPRSGEISKVVSAVLERIGTPDEADDSEGSDLFEELDRLEKGGRLRQAMHRWIDAAYRLEAGPVSLQSAYDRMERVARALLRDAVIAEKTDTLNELARLRGAGGAKAQALSALDADYGQQLLAAVRSLDSEIDNQARPHEGVFRLGVSESAGGSESWSIALQRSFVRERDRVHFNFVLKYEHGELTVEWVAPESAEPDGASFVREGAVFFFEEPSGCRGLRLVGQEGVLFEGCPVTLSNGKVVELKEVLVGSAGGEDAPLFYRRGTFESGKLVAPESSLEKGLRLFERGQYRAAASAFEEAANEVDPFSPYDEVDLRYNQARCLQEMGKVPEALALFETVGDVAYQSLVDEQIGILESGGRR